MPAYIATKVGLPAGAARPHRRRERRQPRASGLPAGAADPRAAYPPRKGDFQHLHRAGAAGGDRVDVCASITARTGFADCVARGAHCRDIGRRASGPRLDHSDCALLRHDHGRVGRASRTQSLHARWRAASICGGLRAGSSRLAISCDETTTPEIVESVWAAFGTKASMRSGGERVDRLPRSQGHERRLHSGRAASHQRVHDSSGLSWNIDSETEMLRYLRRSGGSRSGARPHA